ncbi:hypothetical protein SAMN05421759_107110 [Roseivivax lentus]|uniref:Minor curlin subunit n=1 Tax=Roseivivax lentus TaxID=633194 RepID=A0A1N7NA57_9RHOB|nr:hypothetical protein [Roseivivax lentus]SIS95079.1 hypothetical protein SAMN05421759_107110 [Roseivivax lentus]
MIIRAASIFIGLTSLPTVAAAQEAFMTQISVPQAGFTATLPAGAATPDIQGIVASLEVPAGPSPAPTIDLSDYPLVAAPTNGAIADIQSTGDNNTVTLVQNGINAASAVQSGNWGTIQMVQTGQNNRASVYQASSYASASVLQTGNNNSALIIQR